MLGHIDNQIVAFYMTKTYADDDVDVYPMTSFSFNDTESFVKFGSYDPEGLQDPADLVLINTIDLNSWAFTLP